MTTTTLPESPEAARVLEEMRKKLATALGVTLIDNRLTLRFNMDEHLCDVHMVILEVSGPTEAKEAQRHYKEFREIMDKYKKSCPRLEAELFHLETGEWPD